MALPLLTGCHRTASLEVDGRQGEKRTGRAILEDVASSELIRALFEGMS
jgi:hypothetical protein